MSRVSTKNVKSRPTPAAPREKRRESTVETDVAIVGGGVAGLYCGYRLLRNDITAFEIAEATEHLGGRIWSTRVDTEGVCIDGDIRLKGDASKGFFVGERQVEFVAEFGPMRIELELQKHLDLLIRDIGLAGALKQFPPYQSPTSKHDPTYELQGDEREQATPLDLLQLAIVRVLGRLRSRKKDETIPPDEPKKETQDRGLLQTKLNGLVDDLSRAIATRQLEWKDVLLAWIETLEEPDYQTIRQYGVFDDGNWTPLWDMGFWNLLSEVLSHHAVMKIRDLGTFYHLIPENPNAAEWLIFWLRLFRTSNQLVGIHGGIQRITENMVDAITKNKIHRGLKLVGLKEGGDGRIELSFEKEGDETDSPVTWKAKHVILALPTGPMQELVKRNEHNLYSELHRDLASVFGFPLLKFFVSVKERWWPEDAAMANRFATLIPARELHYWNSSIAGSRKGLVMVYTDRPATTFWSNYINPGEESQRAKDAKSFEREKSIIASGIQRKPEQGKPNQNGRLINKALQYLNEYGVKKKKEDIEFYGIRDWGREPSLGAAHAWYPERKSWEILRRLSSFAIGSYKHDEVKHSKDQRTIHVCGEAYSDYQAFIEGALRSSDHVLHNIYPRVFRDTPTRWLCREEDECSHPEKQELPYYPARDKNGAKKR